MESITGHVHVSTARRTETGKVLDHMDTFPKEEDDIISDLCNCMTEDGFKVSVDAAKALAVCKNTALLKANIQDATMRQQLVKNCHLRHDDRTE